MEQGDIAQLEKLLPLADKYGLAYVVALVLMIVVIVMLRAIVKGSLVPRELLDKAEEDRDRLQAILDKERSDFMQPTLDVLKKLKVDQSEDRGA
ncbi:hypothetical protein D3C81_381560 [compost metagenome]|uniref:hypothetical protein n=1 Tax=Paenibacillus TaxID=44249 RepID=UPI000FBACAD6|nr:MULTISPECIES: hypothetical protein [Paenibacillus]MBY9079057.1 hypothetical protein [Paenibacillus sp. CGMCC 1.18879]MBY9086835.1 hypothetical protein [Paenibacillus sinensis]